jgi:hypothetical protein
LAADETVANNALLGVIAVQATVIEPLDSVRESDTKLPKSRFRKNSFCKRPGCYIAWFVDPRTPHKKFCSSMCDNALRAASTRVQRYYQSQGYVGAITPRNRMNVLLAKPGSRGQVRAFQSVVLRC